MARRLFPAVPGASSNIVDVQKMPLAMVFADGFINGHTAAVGGELRRIRTVPLCGRCGLGACLDGCRLYRSLP
ncbi:hypothetical protein [Paenibacillus sp. YSY-4.3]